MRTTRTAWPKACGCAAATGVSGLSIEDSTGDPATPLYDFDLAVARMKAARAAIDKAGGDVLLTGRSEGFIRGRPDLDETIRRLKAYADAGADCLYSPGITTREQIGAVIKAVAPKPVNVLIGWAQRPDGEGSGGAGRAAHQRRRRAGAHGLERLHAGGQNDRRDGQLQGHRQHAQQRRAEQVLHGGPAEAGLA